MFPDSRIDSPDGKHFAELTFVQEIRFGPEYFSLTINDRSFGKRIFGHCVLWSPDSSVVCVQEWHNTVYSSGPQTSLLLIRPANWSFYAFPTINGFASPDSFVDSSLLLRHSDSSGGMRVVRETDLSKIEDWRSID